MDKYKYKRRQIKELKEDMEAMQATSDNLSQEEQRLAELLEEKGKATQAWVVMYHFHLLTNHQGSLTWNFIFVDLEYLRSALFFVVCSNSIDSVGTSKYAKKQGRCT